MAKALEDMKKELGITVDITANMPPDQFIKVLYEALVTIKGVKEEHSRRKGLSDLMSNRGVLSAEKFAGGTDRKKFRGWTYTTRANIKTKDPDLARLMVEAERMKPDARVIDDAHPLLNTDEAKEKDQMLHAYLLNMTEVESEPFKILENNDGQGLESWRRFQQRWDRLRPLNSIDITEEIRSLKRCDTAGEVPSRMEDLRKLILDWERVRMPPGGPTIKYDPVDYKTDIMRLIPKEWIMKLKLDHEMDFEMCSVTDLSERIDKYVTAHLSADPGQTAQPRSGKQTGSLDKDGVEEAGAGEEPEYSEFGRDVDSMNTNYNPNIICWSCGGKGHPKSKCWQNPNKGKGKGQESSYKGKGSYKGGNSKGSKGGNYKGQGHFSSNNGKGGGKSGAGYPSKGWGKSSGKHKDGNPTEEVHTCGNNKEDTNGKPVGRTKGKARETGIRVVR